MSNNVKWFKELSKDSILETGGKGNNLGIMYNLGLPVPPGFVVTAQAYKSFIESTGIASDIYTILANLNVDDNNKLQEASVKIGNIIKSKELPNQLKEELFEAYDSLDESENVNDMLKSKEVFVAVRSSATAEDLPSISENEHVFVSINNKPFFGTMKELGSKVKRNDELMIPALHENKVQWKQVSEIYRHKVKDKNLFKITTSTGREIVVSPNHSLIILDENNLKPKVAEIAELKGNERVSVIKNIPRFNTVKSIDILDYITKDDVIQENDELMIKNNSNNWKIQQAFPRHVNLTEDFAYLLGLYASEGTTFGTNNIIITNSDEAVISKLKECFEQLELNSQNKLNKGSLRVYSKVLVRLLNENCGVPDLGKKGKGKTCYTKRIPNFIFSASPESIAAYLRGCFDGDGTVEKDSVSYTSVSEGLISGICLLLEILDIEFYVRRKRNSMTLAIPAKHMELFNRKIGFLHSEKNIRLQNLLVKYKSGKIHFDAKNSFEISNNVARMIRESLEDNLPKSLTNECFCSYCYNKAKKSSKYKNLERYYCKQCEKSLYERDIERLEVEKYVNYNEKGQFIKNSTPWNASINTHPNYGMDKFKQILIQKNLEVAQVFDNSILWDKIKKIEKISYDSWVYDFTVPNAENFSAGIGSVITHNSNSFAGQQATFLNIKGHKDLANAVRECWASLFTARAIYYRVKNKFEHQKVFIAVVVQKMVNSEESGIMFSINPTTNNEKEIVIEAVYGLGEAIVSGSVNPNTFIVDKDSLTIKDKKIRDQSYKMVKDKDGKNVNLPLAEDEKGEQTISNNHIVELAQLAKKIEKHYGMPQDIEWAVEGKKVYIVQSRAVTTFKKQVQELKKESEDKIEIDAKVLLSGDPASPGIASGPVKIIKDASELDKITEGDILVTSMTNPDMVPAMERAAAIITDMGGRTCFSADTKVLTDKGFLNMVEVNAFFDMGESLNIFSYNYKEKKPEWKRIINTFRKKGQAIRVATSQKNEISHNFLDITQDHKMFTFENRNLIKKSIKNVLENQEMLCLVDKLPDSCNIQNRPKLSYLTGALASDGYVRIENYITGNPRRGSVTLIQKETEQKLEFINTVKSNFNEIFGYELNSKGEKTHGGVIRTKLMSGSATQFTCSRLEPALKLKRMMNDLDKWTLTLDEVSCFNLLAGLIDGDGCLHNNRLHIYVEKEHVLQSIVIACLKLEIIPQITVNRNIHHVQIVEKMEEILSYTKRVKGEIKERSQGTKLFSAKQILGDVINDINYKGRIKPYVKKNLLLDSRKLAECIIPLADEKLKNELLEIINSNLRMHRTKQIEELGMIDVYNIEVYGESEMEKNYVVFTSKYTPLLVSNCHASIVSREMGTPCVVGTEKATKILKEGMIVTVDGLHGAIYEGKVEIKHQEQESHSEFVNLDTVTKVKVNCDLPKFASKAAATGADGVGLARVEFMIVNAGKHPAWYIKNKKADEYTQVLVDGIVEIAKNFKDKPVWVRTSDIRTDEYRNLKGGEDEPREINPMIGWHAIRRGLDEPEILRAEFRAIKKIHELGYKNVGVMLPFIIRTDEVVKAKKIMREIGLEPLKDVDFGIMVETPAACWIIEELCKEGITFVSFGTNDLTQCTLGLDRDNGTVAKLFDEMHPAVLGEIKMVISTCNKYGVITSICGQAGSRPEMAEFLVKTGITSISANVDAVQKIKATVAKIEHEILEKTLHQG